MGLKVKAVATREIFHNDNFYIIAFNPITPFPNELKLSQYGNFTCKGELGYISIGKEYEMIIKEKDTSKFGTSYEILEVPSMKLDSLTDSDELEILREITTESQAQNIHEAYPNFIRLVIDGKENEIDVNNIYNVGEIRFKAYLRIINEKFKYFYLKQKYPQYQLDISDCKVLYDFFIDENTIDKEITDNPYRTMIYVLDKSFEYSDKIIMECRPDLENSEQRCEFLIINVLKRNEVDGSTRLNGKDLYYYCKEDYQVPNLLPMLKDVAVNSDLIYYDEESKDLSIMDTYLGECKIASFIKNKLENSTKLDIDWTKYTEIDGFKMSDMQSNCLKNFCEYNFSLLVGYSGSGKAQPIDTIIPTPNGNKKLGDIKVGDYVFDRLGKPTKVLGVYPQGIKDCYTVTLNDGRQTKCNDEHLWTYYSSKGNFVTKTLRQMIDDGIYHNSPSVKKNGIKSCKYNIPICKAVEYEEKKYNIDPYVIGSFLGNGCCLQNRLTISSGDLEQVEEVARLLNATPIKENDKNYNYNFVSNVSNDLYRTKYVFKDYEKELCTHSYNKFIPTEYKYGSIEQRYALLQGLLDTDGYISKNDRYNVSYSTTSKKLAEDIKEIVYSLGYSCSITIDNRLGGHHKHICYNVHLLVDNSEKYKLFRLSRKKEIALSCKDIPKHRLYDRIKIAKVEKDEKPCEMVCIYVDNDEHLYLTNDYIVTHNTTSIKGLISLLEDNNMSYTLLAPTGKASLRMSEATHRKASTIHRKVLRDGEIDSDVIIVDECSMIDLPTFVMLLDAISNPNCRIVFVGDNAQLMPVGIGCVFNDIINSNKVPMTMLTEVFRYNSSGALYVATNARQGKPFFDNDDKLIKRTQDGVEIGNNYKFIQTENIFDAIVEQYNNLLSKGVKPKEILCLSPFNVGDIGTYAINNEIQSVVNAPKPNETIMSRNINNKYNVTFRVGDALLNKKNDYKALPLESWEMLQNDDLLSSDDVPLTTVFNGQDGIIRDIDEKKIVAQFDEELVVFDKIKLSNLLLSYCISVHSSQGSEAKYVINVVSPKHERMLNRNLLYVADTRSKVKQIDIGDMDTYNKALLIDGNKERNTFLKELLLESAE